MCCNVLVGFGAYCLLPFVLKIVDRREITASLPSKIGYCFSLLEKEQSVLLLDYSRLATQ